MNTKRKSPKLPTRSGRRKKVGTGQGWGMSVTKAQLAAYRKAQKERAK